MGQHVQMTMTCLLGHIIELDFESAYSKWQSCDPQCLFEAPIIKSVSKDMRGIEQNLLKESRHCEWLIIWTDCDLEGENIGGEVSDICRRSNPNIQVFRARFSVVNAADLFRACQHLGPLDTRQVSAVDARSELDLRLGAMFTRLMTIRLQSRHTELAKHIISYGSCQFPTLGFVVEQYLRAVKFISEPFWSIKTTLTKGGLTLNLTWNRGALFDQLACLILYENCLVHSEVVITHIQTTATSKWRPLPLTTVEFQKFGSRVLGISSDRLMKIAEVLYNRGLISYPRTETDQFEPTFDLKAVINKQTGNETWGTYAQRLLNDKLFCAPRKGKHNDKAHPPIHPTANSESLEGDEKRVFEFVTRRFLACCSQDARGLQTTVHAVLAGEGFSTAGLQVTERNYLEIYIYDKWTDCPMPELSINEKLVPSSIIMTEGRTSAPSLLSEADLIGIMDRNGIGTDATIHEHIKKIQDRHYAIKRNDSRFIPSRLGLALVESFDSFGFEMSLTQPLLRSQLEMNMKAICDGQKTNNEVVLETLTLFRSVYERTLLCFETLHQTLSKYLINGQKPEDMADFSHQNESTRRARGTHQNQDNYQGDDDNGNDDDHNNNGRAPPGQSRNIHTVKKKPRTRTETKENNSQSQSNPANISCSCADISILLTVKKEGPNNGRQFYSCPKPRDDPTRCDLFQWADEESNVGNGTALNNSSRALRQSEAFSDDCNSIPSLMSPSPSTVQLVCHCQQPSITRQCKRDGPNKDRYFYVCAKSQNRCDFFSWVVETAPNSSTTSSRLLQEAPRCQCGFQMTRQISSKPESVGRAFYSCSRAVNRCKTFYWEDEVPHNSTAEIRCFKCRQLGHDATKCTASTVETINAAASVMINHQQQAECFRCQQMGHYAAHCPNATLVPRQPKQQSVCYKCNETGHFANACPAASSIRTKPGTKKRKTTYKK